MKSYACYPKSKMRFQTPYSRLLTPNYFPQAVKPSHEAVASYPSANIFRAEGAYTIQLALPGLTREQIKIELNEDQLIISAITKADAAKPEFIRREFDFSGFKRIFRLHKNADTSALSACFSQGILTIIVPDATPETIQINIL